MIFSYKIVKIAFFMNQNISKNEKNIAKECKYEHWSIEQLIFCSQNPIHCKNRYLNKNFTRHCKVECIFTMVIWSDFRMRQYTDHQEDAPHFMVISQLGTSETYNMTTDYHCKIIQIDNCSIDWPFTPICKLKERSWMKKYWMNFHQ